MRTALGIDVDDELLDRWRTWLCPKRRPWRLNEISPDLAMQVPMRTGEATDEIRDTIFGYSGTFTWLTEDEFFDLPPQLRRAMTSAMRRHIRHKPLPPWPSQLVGDGAEEMIAWVEAGVRRSRHDEVPGEVWSVAAPVLPRARELAGTFPTSGSGANCFATLVAAAGDPSADDLWMQIAPITRWLEENTEAVHGTAHDLEPGTVLVWHQDGEIAHVAVTIGGGFALSKPSQAWSSPRLVWTVRETVDASRYPGTRLSRRRIR